MSTFSLDLIEKEFVHYWLMSKKVKFESETLNVSLDFLACPQAVVNNIVLGQVFGDPYYFALPDVLRRTVHPTSRRFVFDLEENVFLEFHWYASHEILLTVWLKFVTDMRLVSYFVIYDMTGNKSRRPQRVIQSKEIVLQKQSLIETESRLLSSETSNRPVSSFLPTEEIERRLESIPQAREFVRNLLGSFEGFIRTSEFELNTFKMLRNNITPCKVDIGCRESSDEIKVRERNRWCIGTSFFPDLPVLKDLEPLHVVHKLMQCSVSDMERWESFLSCSSSQTVSPPAHSIQKTSSHDTTLLTSSRSEIVKPKMGTSEKRFRHVPRNPSMRMQQRYEATERQLYDHHLDDVISSDSYSFSPNYACTSENNEEQKGLDELNDCYFSSDTFSESIFQNYGF
ncbi:hypothetical protein GpartN1_g12.t1 [Galdieria partita]|uniref:Uncharacterized protein n=1 Tax=Galdieria partita TaxID=83374 RepID=A0A9C7PQW4_9RHOD|nr:hypothetical protein GpartN1_g12.t1 [Galdieria partita]